MAALGQKLTFAVQYAMSALPPKADMCGATGNVRNGPEDDIAIQSIAGGAVITRLATASAAATN